MAYRAKAARVGHYKYAGHEVDPDNKHGLRDQAVVNVARYSEDVHDPKSAHSFIGKPITDDHPRDPVTRDNWRDHARGTVMGAKWEEGGYLAFDLMLTDGTAIDKVAAGKRELSNGYSCDLVHGDFTATDGTPCQFKQTNIRGNHVAIVDKGRAGPACAIRDAATCESVPLSSLSDSVEGAITWLKKAIALHKKHMDGTAPTTGAAGEKSQMLMMTQMEKALAELEPGSGGKTMKMDHFNDGVLPVKTMLIDGLTVDMANADTAIATVQTLIAARDAAVTANAAKDREIATKDTEIADLKSKVTDQAAIDALADAKADVVARGKAILGDAMPETKGKTVAEVRRAVVLAATKDAALADKSDDYIEARFDGLKDTAPTNDNGVRPLFGSPSFTADAVALRDMARRNRNA